MKSFVQLIGVAALVLILFSLLSIKDEIVLQRTPEQQEIVMQEAAQKALEEKLTEDQYQALMSKASNTAWLDIDSSEIFFGKFVADKIYLYMFLLAALGLIFSVFLKARNPR